MIYWLEKVTVSAWVSGIHFPNISNWALLIYQCYYLLLSALPVNVHANLLVNCRHHNITNEIRGTIKAPSQVIWIDFFLSIYSRNSAQMEAICWMNFRQVTTLWSWSKKQTNKNKKQKPESGLFCIDISIKISPVFIYQ